MTSSSPLREQPHRADSEETPRRTAAGASGPWGLGIAGLALAWAGLSWGWFWWRVSPVLDRFDTTFVDAYRVRHPGFANGFQEGLPTGPGELFRNGGLGTWWVVVAIFVVGVYWWRSAAQLRGPGLAGGHLLATAAPLLAGIGYFPWGVVEVSATLAEAGLSTPVLIGLGLGEATSPAIFGTLASALMLIGLSAWRARARR